MLAREITLPNSSFLLAAQPTRGLDVGAVAAVYGHIRAACGRGAAVLLISSELDELIAVADRIVVLYRGRIVGKRRPLRASASDRRDDVGTNAMSALPDRRTALPPPSRHGSGCCRGLRS